MTVSMNGPPVVSQVTLFVPSVAVPAARLMVRGAVTTLDPQAKQRPSLSG